jgi:hypothetical protein
VPKISDSCILVNLRISVFSGSRTDKKLTGDISEMHHTKNDALRVVKRLVSKEDPDLQLVNKIVSEIRNFHKSNTVPWGDDGARMLPGKHHDVYMKNIRGLIEKGEVAAAGFCAKWPEKLAQAKIDLNGTFNSADYPDETTIASHFSFTVIRAPVPDGGDIRVDLPGQEIESMRREISDRVKEAEKAAENELYSRLGEKLANLVNKLREKTADGKPAVFRDTLVGNVMEIANLIPALNVTGDPKLDQIRREIIATIGSVRPDELRGDVFTRKETMEKAQNILDMMMPPQQEAA